MTVEDLIEECKLELGQFRLDNFEWDTDEFTKLLTRRVLPTLYKYSPYSEIQHVYVSTNIKTFTEDIPDWISTVTFSGDVTINSEINHYLSSVQYRNSDIRKTRLLWTYRKPTLTCNFGGDFEITAIYNGSLVGTGKDAVITNVSDEDLPHIIDLVNAYVLMGVGRGRNLIIISEIPVEMNGAEMLQEGKELLAETTQELKENSKTWLAWK